MLCNDLTTAEALRVKAVSLVRMMSDALRRVNDNLGSVFDVNRVDAYLVRQLGLVEGWSTDLWGVMGELIETACQLEDTLVAVETSPAAAAAGPAVQAMSWPFEETVDQVLNLDTWQESTGFIDVDGLRCPGCRFLFTLLPMFELKGECRCHCGTTFTFSTSSTEGRTLYHTLAKKGVSANGHLGT